MVASKASTVGVTLSEYQAKRLQAGHRIRLSHDQLKGKKHQLELRPRNNGKIATALRNKKGLEISLAPGERLGGSLIGQLRGAYDRHVKPQVRPWLHRQASAWTPVASDAVERQLSGVVGSKAARRVASAIDPASHNIINRVGDATGAYGVVQHGGRVDWKQVGRTAARIVKPYARPLLKSAATSGLTAIGAPELAPAASLAVDAAGDKFGFGARRKVKKGGSFKPVGY